MQRDAMDALNPSMEHLGLLGVLVVMLLKDWLIVRRMNNSHGNRSPAVLQSLHELEREMAILQTRLEVQEAREIPPAWFREEVRQIKESCDRMHERLSHELGRPKL